MKKYILFILMAVISMAVAIFVTKWLKKPTPTKPPQTQEKDTITVEDIIGPMPVDNPIEIRLLKMESTGTNQYQLEVQAENLPEGMSVKYKIREFNKVNPDTDGCFTSLPGNKAGRYTVELLDASVDTLLAEQTFDGFVLSAPEPVKKMTASEVKSYIIRDGVTKDKRILTNVAIRFFGIREGDKQPQTLYDIHEKVEMQSWSSFEITDIQHDSQGRVSYIQVQPIYP